MPDESLHGALCTTAYRGVDTTIVFPARNDSRFVGAASRSYYADLLNDTWRDKNGKPFQPGVHYFVAGATKMYGAALYRFAQRGFW